jgi:hypothetical protein
VGDTSGASSSAGDDSDAARAAQLRLRNLVMPSEGLLQFLYR